MRTLKPDYYIAGSIEDPDAQNRVLELPDD